MERLESAATAAGRSAPVHRTSSRGDAEHALLRLQRQAGNRAVASVVAQRSSPVSEEAADGPGPQDAGAVAGVPGPEGGDIESGVAPAAQIDVRATKITGLRGLPVYHLFVVYTDEHATPYYFRGGPERAGGAAGFGRIVTQHGRYQPGTVDWAPGAPSERVMEGPAAIGKDATFRSDLARIDGASIPYQPTGPNSNSVARTILSTAGVPQAKPVWVAPGWGTIL